MKRLAIITTHPIQYNAPLFRLLAIRGLIDIKVFYTWGQSKDAVYDPGFGRARSWDIPLLDGYPSVFLDNPVKNPGSHHFWGIQNPDILKALKDYAPDAILVYGWSFWSHLRVLMYFNKKVKILFRGDSTLLDESRSSLTRTILRRLFLKWVYSFVDIALHVGSANKRYFEKYGLQNGGLQFAPHAVDNERFADNKGELELTAENWRTRLGIPSDAVVILFAGKLESKKAPALLIQAFDRLVHSSAYLIMVGNGPLEEQLKLNYGKMQRICWIDFQNQSQMPVVYRLGDICILPSIGPGETWGLAINEAFACSRPAIVSDQVGCAEDLVFPGQTGWVFPSDNVDALADTLEAAVALGRAGLRTLGSQAFAYIQKWNFEHVACIIEQTVNDAH